MTRAGAMRGKRLFWAGIGLIVPGGVLIVVATSSTLAHGAGVLLVFLGFVLAIRNYQP